MKKIQFYATEKGLLVRLETRTPANHRINDKTLTATFHPSWWIIEEETALNAYTVHAGIRKINERYVLNNTAIEGLDKEIPLDQLARDDEGYWAGKHKGLEGLYRYESDQEDLGFRQAEFEAHPLGTLTFKSLGDPTRFSYKLYRQRWDERHQTLDYASLRNTYGWLDQVIVDEIAKAMTPDIAWHLHPCSVSSPTSYRLIRAHVKDHIDPRYAEITSDYDFCFTVKKKIRIVPHTKQTEIRKGNGKSYRPPKFKSRTVDYELREVFEMTNSKDRYSGYTVLEGFKGESLEDLARNIDVYLAELMKVINAPLTRCPKCDGTGVTDYSKLPTNERKQFGVTA